MALPSSGAISLLDIVAEFGGSAPHSLTEYYRGGAYVPNVAGNLGVPTSGAIKLTDFYGASAASFTPVTRIYTSGTSATETAPTGCSNVVIAVWGAGASGNGTSRYSVDGGHGGGSGGYVQSSYAISGGQTLTYTVAPTTAAPVGANPGNDGAASTVSSGSKTITSMTGSGGTVIAGGGASGGNVSNTAGNDGQLGQLGDEFTGYGGMGGSGGLAIAGWGGNSAGEGGSGGDGNYPLPGSNNPGTLGYAGKVIFYYT